MNRGKSLVLWLFLISIYGCAATEAPTLAKQVRDVFVHCPDNIENITIEPGNLEYEKRLARCMTYLTCMRKPTDWWLPPDAKVYQPNLAKDCDKYSRQVVL